MAAADIPYWAVLLIQSHDSGELLTDYQWKLSTEALGGCYDIPRNCTLADLAATLDVNISAASRLRHRAE
ncbi:helix-turn-helix domain-containing protein [Halocatena marina]|nr:helix-turn-helix domain-containing protein [Halocatena marina]